MRRLRSQPSRGRLLERSGELATLKRAVREVSAGGSATVVVLGRPGTGRSALLAETAVLARRAGLHVVAGGATPSGAWTRGTAEPAPSDRPTALLVDDGPVPGMAPDHARRFRGRPLLYVVAGTDATLLDVDGPARRGLALGPLSPDAVRALLVEAYGEDAAAALVPVALAATGGDPAVLCGTIRRRPAPAPDPEEFVALADQVGRHHLRHTLARTPEPTAALLRACAVTDGDFPLAEVCRLAGAPAGSEMSSWTLARTGLLGSVEQPRLHHPTLTDRMLGLMDDDLRRELYERAVRLGHAGQMPQPVLGRLVAHTDLTASWVPEALYAAGAQARRSGDDAAAMAFLERAIDRGASGALRTEVLLELAQTQASRRPEAADRGLRRVLATTAADRSATRLVVGDLLAVRGGGATADALAAAARATESEADRRTLHALRELTLEGGSAEVARTPDVVAGSVADVTQAAALAWRHCAAGREIGQARRFAGAVLARAGFGQFAAGLAAARVLIISEDMNLARQGLERIEAEARRHGVRPAIGLALLTRAELALQVGAVAEAGDLLAEAVDEVPRRHWDPQRLPRLVALEALIALGAGRADRAESALARGVPDGGDHGVGWARLFFARGALAVRTGRSAQAIAQLRECGRILLARGCPNPALAPWRSFLGMAQSGENLDAAAELLSEDLAAVRAWGAPGMLGSVHLWAGQALTGPAALAHLRSAVRTLGGSLLRGRHVLALAELSDALLDAGQPAESRRMLDQAIVAAHTVGGVPLHRVREVTERYAAMHHANRARLSPAQLRVALLAATGLSNKAIADQLSISSRAVELHLSRNYRILGIRGRAELAGALGRDDG